MTTRGDQEVGSHSVVRSAMWTGVMIGIGIMGAIDEIVFHQLLQWHNFYVHTDQYWRIFSDGVFHAFTAAMLFLGALRLWSLRRDVSRIVNGGAFWAGILIGAGAFQLFDGLVSHKLLQIHPAREGVDNLLPYDLGWNGFGLLLLVAGWLVWRSARKATSAAAMRREESAHHGRRST